MSPLLRRRCFPATSSGGRHPSCHRSASMGIMTSQNSAQHCSSVGLLNGLIAHHVIYLPLAHLILGDALNVQCSPLPREGLIRGRSTTRQKGLVLLLLDVLDLRGEGRNTRTCGSLDCRVSPARRRIAPALLPGPLTSPVSPDKTKREHQGGYRAQHLGRPEHGLLARSRLLASCACRSAHGWFVFRIWWLRWFMHHGSTSRLQVAAYYNPGFIELRRRRFGRLFSTWPRGGFVVFPRHRSDPWDPSVGPLTAIPVRLLAFGLCIPTCLTAHVPVSLRPTPTHGGSKCGRPMGIYDKAGHGVCKMAKADQPSAVTSVREQMVTQVVQGTRRAGVFAESVSFDSMRPTEHQRATEPPLASAR